MTILPINLDEHLSVGESPVIMNIGHAALSKIYHELQLAYVLDNRRRYEQCTYIHNAILKMLVYSRLLHPGSIKQVWETRGVFVDAMDFSLADVYHSLAFFHSFKGTLLTTLEKGLEKERGKAKTIFSYECNKAYIGPASQDDHTPNTIGLVAISLCADEDGIPLSYELSHTNKSGGSPSPSFLPNLAGKDKKKSDGMFVFVTDTPNEAELDQMLRDGNSFIVGYPLSEGEEEIMGYALDPSEYWYKKKSIDKNTGKLTIKDCPWDPQAPMTQDVFRFKTRNFSNLWSDLHRSLPQTVKLVVTYNQEDEDYEQLEGYQVLLTNRLDMHVDQIISSFYRLREIEEMFAVPQTEVSTRPATEIEEYLEVHFLTCYLACTLLSIVSKRLEGVYSNDEILENLKNCNAYHLGENIYRCYHTSDCLQAIGRAFDLDFTRKNLTRADISELVGRSKKKE